MADKYDGMDEATLRSLLEEATDYEQRSQLRKAIRRLKGGDDLKGKRTGSTVYRRPGFQAPKSHTIPNSVTGNVLPDKVSLENISKVEKPQSTATISYLKSPHTSLTGSAAATATRSTRNRSSPRGSTSQSPRGSVSSPRASVSSATPEPSIREKQYEDNVDEVHSRVNGHRVASPEVRKEPTPEPVREPSPEPIRVPTPEPEPVREPTPEPPREPTPEPEPVKEPTPEPPREPTPEPEPVREPTPEPPREPTPEPEPVREPTPEPIKEPTPEPEELDEPDTTPAVADAVKRSPTPEEEEEEEESEGDEDEEDSEEEEDEDEREIGSDARREYRSGRSTGEKDIRAPPDAKSVPMDVLTVQEEGVEDGDFRTKLRKATNTKINTSAAFPQAKPKGDQVDFRDLLRKSDGPERKRFRTGGSAQEDFRGNLKKSPKKEPAQLPERAPKPSRRRDRPTENVPEVEDEKPVNQDEEQVEQEEEEAEAEAAEGVEPQEEGEGPDQEGQEDDDKDDVDAAPGIETEEISYEERQADRKKRREQRRKELEEVGDVEKEEKSIPNGTSEPKQEGVSLEEDSYEARREARRKAREGRLKAAASQIDEKPRMSYRERKAREQLQNAKENRKKWANREEESGDKNEQQPPSFKKNKDSATQQLLAWCQHKTKYYENVEIKDFRQSWSNGLAFCAILHSFLPDKIPYDDLTDADPRNNFTIAFDAAKEAGIPEMLDVDDMVAIKIPDSKSIMTFLVTIYQHFNS